MSDKEKVLLLQLILEDIRGNWGWGLNIRVDKALELANELEFDAHIKSISQYKELVLDGEDDGRFFMCDYTEGGMRGMDVLHNLKYTIMDKSYDFKFGVNILTYPEYAFDDWLEYKKLERQVKIDGGHIND